MRRKIAKVDARKVGHMAWVTALLLRLHPRSYELEREDEDKPRDDDNGDVDDWYRTDEVYDHGYGTKGWRGNGDVHSERVDVDERYAVAVTSKLSDRQPEPKAKGAQEGEMDGGQRSHHEHRLLA